jgi:FkbM family methyltransferase
MTGGSLFRRRINKGLSKSNEIDVDVMHTPTRRRVFPGMTLTLTLLLLLLLLAFVLVSIQFTKTPNTSPSKQPPSGTSTPIVNSFPNNAIQRNAGTGWEMMNLNQSTSEEDICDFVPFESTTGKSAKICVHTMLDVVSDKIRKNKRWGDCDPLPALWNASKTGAKNEVYVEIGANIGSCVMEMLLSTDANIVAFEPTPRNYQVLSRSIYVLGPEYQQRVALFPIALGSESVKSQVFSAEGNMGNSVVGKPIKDFEKQQMNEPVDIYIERIDSVLSRNISIPLMKLDAQGFECQILDGMSYEIVANVHQIKFELDMHMMKDHHCMDLLPRLRKLGFSITDVKGEIIASDSVNCGLCDAYATKELNT